MTTVAYKNGILAADTMLCDGELSGRYDNKITEDVKISDYFCERYKLKPGLVCSVAFAGSVAIGQAMIRYLTGEENFSEVRATGEDYTDGIVAHSDGVFLFDSSGAFIPQNSPFYAIGSGRMVAMGAMHCGKSALESVKIACIYDIHSGGDVVFSQVKR
jgi:hypothetical protein